ncbi:SDR family NAD(P)-dependent oxidoreductase [Paenibacillus filicis]|uniref:SDR family NAD(P)-dependent oxidoreductase n=1 Tax=Paenibacillus filicis TaxID=669464 RepID=A0ABU9DFW9_9BACL
MSLQRFSGKKVVITGAAGVFGGWIARAFAAEGASLYLSDIRPEALEQTARRLPGVDIWQHVTDLTDPESAVDLIDSVERDWSSPDIVINNAGIYPYSRLLEQTTEQWNATIDLNLRAPFLLIQGFARLMIARGIQGSFINISSGAASMAGPGMGNYNVSKAGLEMLTRVFSLELAPHSIRVNSVVPGYAPGSEVSVMTDAHTSSMIENTPLKRTSGPDDAPQAILYLSSDAASFITGTTLSVDGGRTARVR